MPPAGSATTPAPGGRAVGARSERPRRPSSLPGWEPAAAKPTSAQQDEEVPAEEVRLVLDGGAAARRHQDVEQLPVARLLSAGGLVAHRVEDLVDHARDLALRDDEVAPPQRAAPVGGVGAKHVEDAFGDGAIAVHDPVPHNRP